ncbi:Carboxy-terminal domain (CTD) phosphatase [Actinomortierella ambigua]|nr:Carboxy-terminal domain (CTD) phosphatase [Actinomortierella ambigua]
MEQDLFDLRLPAGHLPATIISIKVAADGTVSQGEALVEYEYLKKITGPREEGEPEAVVRRAEIRAPKDGIIKEIHVKVGDKVTDHNMVVIKHEGCNHDVQYGGMCVVCAKILDGPTTSSHINMTHDATTLSVSQNEAERLEQQTVDRLIREGKLSLIVDLDQTLIHATVGKAVDDWINAQGGTLPKDIKMFPLNDSPTPYYIKLRPHLEKFLKGVTQMYELHVYTMGTRKYAESVAKAIDPDNTYFADRILAREDNKSLTRKTIERLFPCDNSMVVVIDDRADVWQYSPNLIKVHPYEFFVGAGDINAGMLPKQEPVVKSEKDSKEEPKIDSESSSQDDAAKTETKEADTRDTEQKPEEGQSTTSAIDRPAELVKAPVVLDDNDHELGDLLEILGKVHERFYDAYETAKERGEGKADVKDIIDDMRKTVLQNCHIVFSSVIPLGQDQYRSEIWRQATSFGARCSTDLDHGVTHLVAAKAGTAKVGKARRMKGVKIVKPEWLYHSISKWKKQDEAEYVLPELIEVKLNKSGNERSTTPPGAPPGTEDELDGLDESIESDNQSTISEGMDENHRPLSISNEEMEEHMKNVEWSALAQEVEDELGDLSETDMDSDASNTHSDSSVNGQSLVIRGVRRPRAPRSRLGVSVTYGGNGDDDDEDDEDDRDDPLGLGKQRGANFAGKGEDSDGDEAMSSDGDGMPAAWGSNGEETDSSGSDEDSETDSQASGRSDRPAKRRRVVAEEAESDLGGMAPASELDSDANLMEDARDSDEEQGEDNEDDEFDEDYLQQFENDIGA